MGGAHPKKPKNTSRYTKIGKLALFFFLVFFWFFFWFFKISKLAWFFLVFFGIVLGQHSKLETGFLGSLGFFFFLFFFGFFLAFLGFFGFFGI